ncbi:MAG: hypothetical protein QHH43_05270 [Candidatus Saccharicenans sp.]|jgi:hypothetical protein|nr:hypothetical protein [Candidatus Saccharicenans sp.]MDH7575153.1 hypothetical protein [Candidatus Saccharicenans sp.]
MSIISNAEEKKLNGWAPLILTRHFFRRLFLNETVFFEEQMVQKTIGIIAILSIFPAYIADSLMFIYLLFPERGAAWAETAMFTTLIMLLIGLITLFEWEVMFLDRRDYLNLMPLPVRPLTVFSAKFISLVMFIGLFTVGINSISSLVFAMYLSESRAYGLLSAFVLLLVHLLVMLAAGCFIFFSMALLVGLFNILLRGRVFQRLLEIIRFGLIVAHIFIIYFFVLDTRWIGQRFENIQALKDTPTSFMMNFPPLWFTGLYQVLMGNREPFFRSLASRALVSLASVVGGFFLITVVSYGRYLKKVSPEGARHFRPSWLRGIIEPIFNFTILRNSVQRAMFWFYHSVLTRSRMHRHRIMSYLGLGLGISLIMLVSTGKYFWKYHSGSMLSLPLVLTFFLLVGVREASSLPVDQPASWAFIISEAKEKWPYFSALRKSVFILLILPLYLAIFAFYSFLWGWRMAGIHGLYCLVFAILLLEVLFFQHRKFPFACSYVPGKSKVHYLWLVYVFSFVAYVSIPRAIEPAFLNRPWRLIFLYLAIVLVLAALRLYHKHCFYPKNCIIYEDSPDISPAELFHAT